MWTKIFARITHERQDVSMICWYSSFCSCSSCSSSYSSSWLRQPQRQHTYRYNVQIENLKTSNWSKVNTVVYRPKTLYTRPVNDDHTAFLTTMWDIGSTSTLYTEPTAIALLRMKWLNVRNRPTILLELITRFQNNILRWSNK